MSLSTVTNQTMTSQEIADLVNKRHDNVKRTIDNLADKGVIRLPQIEDVRNHQEQFVKTYIFGGEQGKRDSIVVVAQLSPEFTAALVDRWTELEAKQQQPVIPQTLPDALRLAADLADQNAEQQKRLEVTEPKAQALDALTVSSGEVGIRDAGKMVNLGQKAFVVWCLGLDKPLSARWMYRSSNGVLHAYQKRINDGYMTQKLNSFVGHDGRERISPKVRFSPAGIAKIAELLEKERMSGVA